MKRNVIFSALVAVSLLLAGCLKSVDELGYSMTITYKGCVVDAQSGTPIVGLRVGIGYSSFRDDDRIYHETNTDESGAFSIQVDLKNFDAGECIKIIGNDQYETSGLDLRGAGQKEYDYGVIKLARRR